MNQTPDISENARWYCVITGPNRQARASLSLYEMGFRTFMPKIRRWTRHARQLRVREVPLLGRYLFVEVCSLTQSFYSVSKADGVEAVLSYQGVSGATPKPFPSNAIEDLRMRYMAGEWDEVSKGHYPVGGRIRIVEGQFENMLATVTSRKGARIDFKLHGENRYGRLQECSVRAA